MRDFENQVQIIAAIVYAFPNISVTGITKCSYLLQEVYGLDTGYRFSLYSYGILAVIGEIKSLCDVVLEEKPTSIQARVTYKEIADCAAILNNPSLVEKTRHETANTFICEKLENFYLTDQPDLIQI
jgi:hypothetical protein